MGAGRGGLIRWGLLAAIAITVGLALPSGASADALLYGCHDEDWTDCQTVELPTNGPTSAQPLSLVYLAGNVAFCLTSTTVPVGEDSTLTLCRFVWPDPAGSGGQDWVVLDQPEGTTSVGYRFNFFHRGCEPGMDNLRVQLRDTVVRLGWRQDYC